MRRIFVLASIIPLSLIAACSQDKAERASEGSGVTQTRMDDIDRIEGTISDEMIDTSESTDEAPLAGASDKEATDAAKGSAAKSNANKPTANDSKDAEAKAGE